MFVLCHQYLPQDALLSSDPSTQSIIPLQLFSNGRQRPVRHGKASNGALEQSVSAANRQENNAKYNGYVLIASSGVLEKLI